MNNVMKGIRILEIAEHTFVPAAAAVLADWGAEVIKVEHSERGDAMRGLAQTGVMDLSGDVHVLLEHSNRGKRSIGIDITTPEGLEVVYKLAETADVFLTNKLPRVLKKLKIDIDDIRARNPDIIYVRGTANGPKGPDAEKGGYDMTAYWCRAGNAESVTPPELDYVLAQPGPAYGDSIGGMTIAGGIAAALLKRERTGEPSIVDVSLLAAGSWALSAAIALSMQTGEPWRARGAASKKRASTNPLSGIYKTGDDRSISLVMLQGFYYWPDFCKHIGREELVEDERFNSHQNLTANCTEAAEIIAGEIRQKTLAEWTEIFSTLKGQWAPIQNTLEVSQDAQVRANGYIAQAATSSGIDFELVASPVQFDEQPTGTSRAPDFNEHGDEILEELGLSQEQVIELKIAGAVT